MVATHLSDVFMKALVKKKFTSKRNSVPKNTKYSILEPLTALIKTEPTTVPGVFGQIPVTDTWLGLGSASAPHLVVDN